MNLSRRSLLSAFTVIPAVNWLRGQQTPPAPGAAPASAPGQQPPTYTTEVKVVNIFATVRDKKGQIVKDLSKEDFVLDEEGRPQVIRYFARETDLPLTLGLLVDTSGSQRNVLNDERSASRRFLGQVLREDRDLAFVIHFDKEVELLEDLTPSREKLEKALDALQVNEPQLQRQRGGGYPPDDRNGSGGGRHGGGTHLYDAVLLASDELMRKQKGRKALVLLTDGVDRGSKTTLFEAVSAAQRADTLVYSILFTDSNAFGNNNGGYGPGMGRHRGGIGYPGSGGGYPGGGYPGGGGGYPGGGENRAEGKKVLEQIARETGGRFIEVSHHLPIDKVFAAIEEDLRSQYSIGYTSDQTGDTAAYRHIHLTTKKKDLAVQAREGYFAS